MLKFVVIRTESYNIFLQRSFLGRRLWFCFLPAVGVWRTARSPSVDVTTVELLVAGTRLAMKSFFFLSC